MDIDLKTERSKQVYRHSRNIIQEMCTTGPLSQGVYRSLQGDVWTFIEVITSHSAYGNVVLVGRGCDRRAIKIYKGSYNEEIYSMEMMMMGIDHPCITRAKSIGTYTMRNNTVRDAIMMSTAIVDFDSIKMKYKPTLETRKRMIYEMCCSIYQVHSVGAAYIDMKSENFLAFGTRCSVQMLKTKLCDYSLAMILDLDGTKRCTDIRMIGHLVPPEIVEIKTAADRNGLKSVSFTYTKMCDVWMLALIIATLYTDLHGIDNTTIRHRFFDVISRFDRDLQGLLVSMTDQNPLKRPTMREVLNNTFFKSVRKSDYEIMKISNVKQYTQYDLSSLRPYIEHVPIIINTIKAYSAYVYHQFRYYCQQIVITLNISQTEAEIVYCTYCLSLGAELCNNQCYSLSCIFDRVRKMKHVTKFIKGTVVGDVRLPTLSNTNGDRVKRLYVLFVKEVMKKHVDPDSKFSFFT